MEIDSEISSAERVEKRVKVSNECIEKPESPHTRFKAPPASSLLRLPIELRLQIYHYCIPRGSIIEVACSCYFFQQPSETHLYDRDSEAVIAYDVDLEGDIEHNEYSMDDIKHDGDDTEHDG